jgi:hypothetical protein
MPDRAMGKEPVCVIEHSRFLAWIPPRKDDPDGDVPHHTTPNRDEWQQPFKRFEASHGIRPKRKFWIVLRHGWFVRVNLLGLQVTYSRVDQAFEEGSR